MHRTELGVEVEEEMSEAHPGAGIRTCSHDLYVAHCFLGCRLCKCDDQVLDEGSTVGFEPVG
eukprot:477258-Hanusia_phi.AAC.1